MKKIVIFGTGGLARMVYTYFTKDTPYKVAAFTVHEKYLTQSHIFGLDVIPFERIEITHPPEQYDMFVAIGYMKANKLRAAVYSSCIRKQYELVTYISSKAHHFGEFDVGDNCLILESAIINPFVKIGNDVLIMPGVLVSHNCTIKDHTFLGPHAVINGNTTIGEYCLIGANATIADGINVAAECIVSAGATINKNTETGEVYLSPPTERSPTTSDELSNFIRSPFFRS